MNLPNGLTFGRIIATPAIAILPFSSRSGPRALAFVLFTLAAITDFVDGYLARSRKEETDLGRLLDPFADKALLVGTLIAMYFLAPTLPFVTPLGRIGLPLWIVLVVLGREVFMTIFRHAAARRGVVIAAITSAKWKTGFQLMWEGSAYCWFWTRTLATEHHWDDAAPWRGFAMFNGTVGALMMVGAVILTLYSLAVYMRSFSSVFSKAGDSATRRLGE